MPTPESCVGMFIVTPSHLRGSIVVKDFIQENGPLPLRWLTLSMGRCVAASDVTVVDAPHVTMNPGLPF